VSSIRNLNATGRFLMPLGGGFCMLKTPCTAKDNTTMHCTSSRSKGRRMTDGIWCDSLLHDEGLLIIALPAVHARLHEWGMPPYLNSWLSIRSLFCCIAGSVVVHLSICALETGDSVHIASSSHWTNPLCERQARQIGGKPPPSVATGFASRYPRSIRGH
jgi:hypothetical protein